MPAVLQFARVAAPDQAWLLTAALPGVFSPAAAASYLVFTALYAPCVAAQAAMRQELGSRLGTLAAAAGSCAAAWCAAAVVYRIAILI